MIVCEYPIIEIYNLMKETNKIIMAIDGGAVKYKGLLGFVLITVDGTLPRSCYGQPAGNDPFLFQSDTYAYLAATRLVLLIAEHYNELIVDLIDISSKVHLFTNSISMSKELNYKDSYPTVYLKQ